MMTKTKSCSCFKLNSIMIQSLASYSAELPQTRQYRLHQRINRHTQETTSSSIKTNTVYNMVWTTNLRLKFLLHVSARLGHKQRQHVRNEPEITKGITLQTADLSQLTVQSITVQAYSIHMQQQKVPFFIVSCMFFNAQYTVNSQCIITIDYDIKVQLNNNTQSVKVVKYVFTVQSNHV